MNADRIIALGALLPVGLAVFVAMWRWPRFGAAIWICSICFVPVWFAVTLQGMAQAHVLVSLVVVASWLFRVGRLKLSRVDVVLLLVLLMVAVEYILGLTTVSYSFVMFTQWAGAYLVGRLITHVVPEHWVYRLVGIAFSLVAVLALVEFATSANVFVSLLPSGNGLFSEWGTLQPRGGVLRAEGAFGHSIAMGTSLAAAIGLSLASRLRPWLKISMVVVMLGAVVVSFSRTAMLSAILAILLVTILGRRQSALSARFRAVVITSVSVGSAWAAGFVLTVFAESDEATGSATYRVDLLELAETMRPMGLTAVFQKSTSSTTSLGNFGSLDNAALLFGLSYGWIPLVLIMACWLGAVVVSLLRRASVPTLVLVALSPAFVTVALITQYAAVVWFLAGLAVATQSSAREKAVPIEWDQAEPDRTERDQVVIPSQSRTATLIP